MHCSSRSHKFVAAARARLLTSPHHIDHEPSFLARRQVAIRRNAGYRSRNRLLTHAREYSRIYNGRQVISHASVDEGDSWRLIADVGASVRVVRVRSSLVY